MAGKENLSGKSGGKSPDIRSVMRTRTATPDFGSCCPLFCLNRAANRRFSYIILHPGTFVRFFSISVRVFRQISGQSGVKNSFLSRSKILCFGEVHTTPFLSSSPQYGHFIFSHLLILSCQKNYQKSCLRFHQLCIYSCYNTTHPSC